MSSESACPHCGGSEVYRNKGVGSAGMYGPRLLPGLGRFFSSATFEVLVCADCGLTRFFADREARSRMRTSWVWKRVD